MLVQCLHIDADRARDLDLGDAMMRHRGDESRIPVIEAERACCHARELIPGLAGFQPWKKYPSMRPSAVGAPYTESLKS